MEFEGIIAGGSAKAQGLGYPTVNIPLREDVSGIYAASVRLEDASFQAVAFADPVRKILEAHLFNYSGNLYGKPVQITLLEKLRDTKVFTEDASLKQAMDEDARAAKAYFAKS